MMYVVIFLLIIATVNGRQYCPNPSPDQIAAICNSNSNQRTCQINRQCGNGRLCCNAGCRKVCLTADVSRPTPVGDRSCPVPTAAQEAIGCNSNSQVQLCSSDAQCNGQLCCRLPCGRNTCLPVPVSQVISQCPASSDSFKYCLFMSVSCTVGGASCEPGFQCCRTVCGNRCVAV